MTTSMNANSLLNNLSNPARPYLWELIIPKPVGGGNSEMLSLRCQSSEFPGRSVGKILIPYRQSAGIGFPGKLAYDHTLTLTFVEGEDRAVFDAIYAWCNSVIDDKTAIAQGAVNIKTDAYLNLLNTDGTTADSIKLVGCYPETQEKIPLDYNNEGAMIFTSSFHYDYWTKAA